MRHSHLVALLSLAAGCASAPASGDTSTSPAPRVTSQGAAATSTASVNRSPDVISQAELADPAVANLNAYEAVRRLRPNFLIARGVRSVDGPAPEVKISIEGGPLQQLSMLKEFSARQVKELRYLSASDARERFGTGSDAGPVIVVKRR